MKCAKREGVSERVKLGEEREDYLRESQEGKRIRHQHIFEFYRYPLLSI